MKKSLLVFAVVICLLLTGCGKKKQSEQPVQAEKPVTQTEVQDPAETEADMQEQAELDSTKTEVVTEEKAPKVY